MKRKAVILLVALILIGAMLTGCREKKDNSGGGGNLPKHNSIPAPRHPRDALINPNAPPPTRNPDGTLG